MGFVFAGTSGLAFTTLPLAVELPPSLLSKLLHRQRVLSWTLRSAELSALTGVVKLNLLLPMNGEDGVLLVADAFVAFKDFPRLVLKDAKGSRDANDSDFSFFPFIETLKNKREKF